VSTLSNKVSECYGPFGLVFGSSTVDSDGSERLVAAFGPSHPLSLILRTAFADDPLSPSRANGWGSYAGVLGGLTTDNRYRACACFRGTDNGFKVGPLSIILPEPPEVDFVTEEAKSIVDPSTPWVRIGWLDGMEGFEASSVMEWVAATLLHELPGSRFCYVIAHHWYNSDSHTYGGFRARLLGTIRKGPKTLLVLEVAINPAAGDLTAGIEETRNPEAPAAEGHPADVVRDKGTVRHSEETGDNDKGDVGGT
jgi:hypothetical protein